MHQLELCVVLGWRMVGDLGCWHAEQHPFRICQNQQSLFWAGKYSVQPEQGVHRNLSGRGRWRRNRQGDKEDGNWLSNHDWGDARWPANLCFQTDEESIASHRTAFQLGQAKVASLKEQHVKTCRGDIFIKGHHFCSKNSTPYQILISV